MSRNNLFGTKTLREVLSELRERCEEINLHLSVSKENSINSIKLVWGAYGRDSSDTVECSVEAKHCYDVLAHLRGARVHLSDGDMQAVNDYCPEDGPAGIEIIRGKIFIFVYSKSWKGEKECAESARRLIRKNEEIPKDFPLSVIELAPAKQVEDVYGSNGNQYEKTEDSRWVSVGTKR